MSGDRKIRVGSRKSELSLIQTRHVICLLSEMHSDKEFEIVSTLDDDDDIGSLYTKELETALATGRVDFVVHSLEDLPIKLPEGMAIGAVLEREDPRDALVAKKHSRISCLNDLKPDSVIGTSSHRQTVQLASTHPHLKVESISGGDLDTQMRILDESDKMSAIIVAAVDLCSMGRHQRITKVLECNEMLYAVGQGAVAVACRQGDIETVNLLEPLHCPKTLLAILAERSFLRTLGGAGGGCSTAAVAVSTKLVPSGDDDGKLSLELTGGVWSLDGGSTELKDHDKCTVQVKPSNTTAAEAGVCPLGYTKDDPHRRCPISMPVGLDFMGQCPYLEAHEEDKCPVNGDLRNLFDEHGAAKCPYLQDAKILEYFLTAFVGQKKTAVCPYREPQLYCALVPSKRTPLWALERAEHLGVTLAEKLLKRGALEVLQAAQTQITAASN